MRVARRDSHCSCVSSLRLPHTDSGCSGTRPSCAESVSRSPLVEEFEVMVLEEDDSDVGDTLLVVFRGMQKDNCLKVMREHVDDDRAHNA